MIPWLLRLWLGGTLLLSAVLKAADFQATAAYFATEIGWDLREVKVALASLILLEVAGGTAVVLRVRPQRRVYAAVFGMLVSFTFAAGLMALLGAESCGCFGTRFALSPTLTILKNIALIAVTVVLYRHVDSDRPALLQEEAHS